MEKQITVFADTDRDGIANKDDPDDDNDGVKDEEDAFPLDKKNSLTPTAIKSGIIKMKTMIMTE